MGTATDRIHDRLVEVIKDVGLCSRVCQAVLEAAAQFTVPILAGAPGTKTLRLLATGTYFRIADKSIVVSAAHAYRWSAENDIFIPAKEGRSIAFVPLNGASYGTKPEAVIGMPNSDTGFDVGATEVAPEEMPSLSCYTPATMANVSRRNSLTNDLYCVTGYPVEHTGGHPVCDGEKFRQLKQLFMGTSFYAGPVDKLASFTEGRHFLLRYDREDYTHMFGSNHGLPQSLCGLSGASIWKTGIVDVEAASWNVSHAKIVGIQTNVYASGIIQGTRWHAIEKMLTTRYPSMRPGFSIVLPGNT